MSKGEVAAREGVCVYCGMPKAVTTEHVVPRAFFPKPKPSNLITVDACFECNNLKSKDDAYVRDVLLLDMASSQNHSDQRLRDGEFIRSVETNRSELARILMSDAKPEPVHSSFGDYLGHALSVPIERERWDRYFSLMVRGLWYYEMHERLPQNCTFDVYLMGRFYVRQAWDEQAEIGARLCVITPNVFATLYALDPEHPYLSRWLLSFYGTSIVEVYTIPEGLDFRPRQGHNGIGVGDSVAFTDAALSDFGQFADKLAKARGVILRLIPISKSDVLAQIRWDQPDIPASVNLDELRRVGETADSRR